MNHEGRLAVVTGGASGIGLAIVERLKSEGAAVAVLDLAETPAADLSVCCDISSAPDVAAAAARIRSELGAPGIVVHSAAYQLTKPFAELTTDEWTSTMRVNVDGAFVVVREFLPAMRKARWGRIVLVASSSFFAPPPGMTHYIASKGALIGFARGLAAEVGVDGVTVNVLAPGLTRTANAVAAVPATHFDAVIANQAVKRSGEPADQAASASFLVSAEAAFMTGQTMLVDGGEGHA